MQRQPTSHLCADGVPTIRALVKFNISENVLQADGGKVLADALKNNAVMTELDISSNYLGEDKDEKPDMSGALAISNAIPTMGAMMSLNISNNNLARGKQTGGFKSWQAPMYATDVSGDN